MTELVPENYINFRSNMRFGRAAFVALLVGVGLVFMGPLTTLIYQDVISVVRDARGLGPVFFATRNILNFATGGLPMLVALQVFAAAFILAGLSGSR